MESEEEEEEGAHVRSQNEFSSDEINTACNDRIEPKKPFSEQNGPNKSNNADKFQKSGNSSMVGKENTPPASKLVSKSNEMNRKKAKLSAQNSMQMSNNRFNLSGSDSDSSSDISFVPDIPPPPMNSKIEKFDESDDELPMFSPPNQTKTTKPVTVPDFIRVLDPTVYNQIQKQNTRTDPPQTHLNKKPKKNEEQVAETIVKHTLNTNHLYFPGTCNFVSSI